MTVWVAILAAVAALITAIGALVAPIIQRRQDRNKPALDAGNTSVAETTVRQMVTELSRGRDIRLWQLEGYVDLDRVWHRASIATTQELTEIVRRLIDIVRHAGLEVPADIQIPDELPPPPEIPQPPHA